MNIVHENGTDHVVDVTPVAPENRKWKIEIEIEQEHRVLVGIGAELDVNGTPCTRSVTHTHTLGKSSRNLQHLQIF